MSEERPIDAAPVVAVKVKRECSVYEEVEVEEHDHEGEEIRYYLRVRGVDFKFDITPLLMRPAPTLETDKREDRIQ